MKKACWMAVAGVVVAAVALAATGVVTSVNIVGFHKITCPKGKWVLVSTAFKSLEGKELKSQDVFGSQLPSGSSIYAWDASAIPPTYVSDNLTFLGWDTNITYTGGMGFWINVPADADQPSYDVYLMGEVPVQQQDSNIVYNGFTMLGYPYTASVLWTNTTLAKKAAQDGDGILYTYDPDGGYTVNNYTFLGWDNPNQVILPSQGFWFQTSSALFTNVEVRPYTP